MRTRRSAAAQLLVAVLVVGLVPAVASAQETPCNRYDPGCEPVPISEVTGFSPPSGVVGTVVTVTGVGFEGHQSVYYPEYSRSVTHVAFGGVPATSFTIVSDTQLRTTVPSGAVTGPITVTWTGRWYTDEPSSRDIASLTDFIVEEAAEICGDTVCVPAPDADLPANLARTYNRLADLVVAPGTGQEAERALARVLETIAQGR